MIFPQMVTERPLPGDGTTISGGGTPDTGGGTPFRLNLTTHSEKANTQNTAKLPWFSRLL